ncbi:MAG: hypothetical protein PVF33_04040, partial [Candidatus Latescibacterota bacterium]
MFERKLISITLLLTLTGIAGPAAAQRCLKIESDPSPATVTVKKDFVMSQTSPGNYCGLQPGVTYRLSVLRRGYETRYLNFSFPDYGQPADFSRVWPGMVGRSVVLPGWGQKAMGQGSRSLETWIFLIADGFKTWQVYDDYRAANRNYKNMLALTEASETQQQAEDRAMLTNKLAEDNNAYRESLILTGALGGWTYLHNVFETYLISASPGTERTEATDFKVSTPRRSGARAALRSFFFPGLGQRYAGHGGRGFLFRTGVFVLALFTIDAKLRYDLAVSDQNYTLTQFNAAESVEEREAMLPGLYSGQVSVEDRKDRLIA